MATQNKNYLNIIRLIESASSIDIDEGRVAYYRYREVLELLNKKFPTYSIEKIASVFVATSPNNDYKGNLISTINILGGHLKQIKAEKIRVTVYHHCRNRAYSYLEGVSFLDTVKGKKIKSFYENILNPFDPVPVTIDGHAVNAWNNRQVSLKSKGARVTGGLYEVVAEDYRRGAAQLGLIPNQAQAICWFAWKRRFNIISPSSQLELFVDRAGDTWQTLSVAHDLLKEYKEPTWI